MALKVIQMDSFPSAEGINFSRKGNAEIDLLKSSLNRKIGHLFQSIIDGLRSFFSWIVDRPVMDIKRFIEDRDLFPLIRKINSHKEPGPALLINRFANHPRAAFVDTYLNGPSSLALSFSLRKPVIIPVILKNHSVGFYVDTDNHTIEFFDPKGLTIRDRNLLGIANEILDECKKQAPSSEWTFKENLQRMQNDSHNSGIYLDDYYQRRLGGEFLEVIQRAPLSYGTANGASRSSLIYAVLQSDPVAVDPLDVPPRPPSRMGDDLNGFF